MVSAPRETMGFRVGGKLAFPGMNISQLRELHFQIEPYLWTEFRNVSLHPGEQTDVKIGERVRP